MKELFLFGEIHNVSDSVFYIINKVKELKKKLRGKSLILHEIYEDDDKDIYRDVGYDVQPLESDVKYDKMSMVKLFLFRELDMINHIEEGLRHYDNVVVVVGDTHLRTTTTKELGVPTLRNWISKLPKSTINVTIVRGDEKYREIE